MGGKAARIDTVGWYMSGKVERRVSSRRVAILGLGYVGLPVVRACVAAGHSVTGFDVDGRVIASLNEGRSHVDDISSDEVRSWLERGFKPSGDPATLAGNDVFVICVPTPLDDKGEPALDYVTSATELVSERLARGGLVILESTTYPGTTDEVLAPIVSRGGMSVGSDVHLAFSPERIDPGNAEFHFENTPKVVGGVTPACTDAAAAFYESLGVDVVRVRSSREAEMAKLLENTYRHVNIALVNELSQLCHLLDIDIWEVIRAARTKPFGFQAFTPGPGVGGHCIPIDPNYLGYRVKSQLGRSFRFVELAEEINAGMPAYVVRRAQEMLNRTGRALNGSRVLLLGVTYKAGIADTRETPADPIARLLTEAGAEVSFHDPLVPVWVRAGHSWSCVADWQDAATSADLVILLQAHPEYVTVLEGTLDATVLDTRGVSPRGVYERL